MNDRSSIGSALALILLGTACYAAAPPDAMTHTTPAHMAASNPVNKGEVATANVRQIDIRNFSFAPTTITVLAGTNITWTNQDSEPHTIASANNAFSASPGMDAGDHFTATFKRPGVYKYFCTIHPNMVGTIIVK